MTGTVVRLHNPFRPDLHREVMPVAEQVSVRGWLTEQGITEFTRPTICLYNGKAILRAEWDQKQIGAGDIVIFVTLPQGGGEGGGGKNPLRTILMLAVVVAAGFVGGVVTAGFGSIIGGLASTGVTVLGSVLVNALVPPPSASLDGYGGTPAPSPTYTLQGQGNRARLSQPIPVIYGRHLTYPDLAATPYGEYQNNDQFLFQLHCIGQGHYDIEDIFIEDTPIASFEEITTQIVSPGQTVTLFNPHVVSSPEVAGQELLAAVDGGDWVGPFVVNPPEAPVTEIGIDIVLPRGLYYAENDGSLSSKSVNWEVEAQQIDDEGTVIGAWQNLATTSHSAASNTPLRLSFKYTVTPARYQVRLRRTDQKATDSRSGHELRWGGMRGYLNAAQDYGDITLLAVKMRATDNLSQRSSRLLNCIVTRKLPIWDGNIWSAPQATRSPAWAFADACRSAYGAGLADARIDLSAIVTLDQIWAARGDRFDGVFDQSVTVWEALNRIARCGRALPFLQGGIVRVVRDESKSLPVALFGPRNIVCGSFGVQYIMPGEETADSVTVEFFNERTWKPDEVTATLSGSSGDNPARVSLFGCTDENQALREGLYMAAANRYRRRLIRFRTELEGLIPTYGDLIAVTHDLPSWGEGGEITEVDGLTLTLSEPPDWTGAGPYYLALRRSDGALSGPWEATPGSSPNEVVLNEPPDITIQTDPDREPTFYAFGQGESWSRYARVLSVRPRGEQVEISAVIESEEVHNV